MAFGCSTVFGGSGFLGRRVVERLLAEGGEVRVACRHPEALEFVPRGKDTARLVPLRADIRDEAAVAAALAGCLALVNAAGLYAEKGDATFQAIHVEGAERLARIASEAGVPRLIHISGIGADPRSESKYVRARAEGERRVRAAFPAATIFRPSVMFGPGDSFFNALGRISSFMPVIPLFGSGSTKLQPVFVGDVAEAAIRALKDPDTRGKTFELGGPHSYTYRSLVEFVLKHMKRRRVLLPVPFVLWDALALVSSSLPTPPITEAQVTLMKHDNLTDPKHATFEDLGIEPRSIDEIVPAYL
jgi:uncharacterized protein YbjT (DUF2867 family)